MISTAGCKIDLSQNPSQKRPISAPDSRTPYLRAGFKNNLSQRWIQERLSQRRIQERPTQRKVILCVK